MEKNSTFNKIRILFTLFFILNIYSCSNRIHYYPGKAINIKDPSIKGYYYRIVSQEEMTSSWPSQIEPLYFFNDSLFVVESVYESINNHDSSIVIYPKMNIYMFQRFGFYKKMNDTLICSNQVNQQMKRPIKSKSNILVNGDTLIDLISNKSFVFRAYK